MVAQAVEQPTLLPPCPELSDARRRLFEAAIVLFGEKGFHAVSVRDLASSLDLQPAALYAHVASKQELLFELVMIGFRTHRDTLRESLLDAGREPADQIAALVRAHVLMHLRYTSLALVTNREARSLSPEHVEAMLAVRTESERAFLEVVERGIRLGAFRVDEPRLAINAIAAMGIRAAEWWTPGGEFTAEQVADSYAAYAIRVLT